MPQYKKIANVQDLPPLGEAREFEFEGKVICVAHSEEGCSAMDNMCIHRGGPLGQGVVDGNKIICPWHGWSFDINTGASLHDASVRVAVYPLKIEGEDVLVGVDE
jgi:nitrite reductase (NADH) small subunit